MRKLSQAKIEDFSDISKCNIITPIIRDSVHSKFKVASVSKIYKIFNPNETYAFTVYKSDEKLEIYYVKVYRSLELKDKGILERKEKLINSLYELANYDTNNIEKMIKSFSDKDLYIAIPFIFDNDKLYCDDQYFFNLLRFSDNVIDNEYSYFGRVAECYMEYKKIKKLDINMLHSFRIKNCKFKVLSIKADTERSIERGFEIKNSEIENLNLDIIFDSREKCIENCKINTINLDISNVWSLDDLCFFSFSTTIRLENGTKINKLNIFMKEYQLEELGIRNTLDLEKVEKEYICDKLNIYGVWNIEEFSVAVV